MRSRLVKIAVLSVVVCIVAIVVLVYLYLIKPKEVETVVNVNLTSKPPHAGEIDKLVNRAYERYVNAARQVLTTGKVFERTGTLKIEVGLQAQLRSYLILYRAVALYKNLVRQSKVENYTYKLLVHVDYVNTKIHRAVHSVNGVRSESLEFQLHNVTYFVHYFGNNRARICLDAHYVNLNGTVLKDILTCSETRARFIPLAKTKAGEVEIAVRREFVKTLLEVLRQGKIEKQEVLDNTTCKVILVRKRVNLTKTVKKLFHIFRAYESVQVQDILATIHSALSGTGLENMNVSIRACITDDGDIVYVRICGIAGSEEYIMKLSLNVSYLHSTLRPGTYIEKLENIFKNVKTTSNMSIIMPLVYFYASPESVIMDFARTFIICLGLLAAS